MGFSEESVDHFFYGSLSPVSLQKLLEVCNINHKLPGAMATIGFPEGLQVQTVILLLIAIRSNTACHLLNGACFCSDYSFLFGSLQYLFENRVRITDLSICFRSLSPEEFTTLAQLADRSLNQGLYWRAR